MIWASGDSNFEERFARFLRRRELRTARVEAAVRKIIRQVRKGGDRALIELGEKFDGVRVKPGELEVPRDQWREALGTLSRSEREALTRAAGRIEAFHRKVVPRDFTVASEGIESSCRHLPLQRVGVYIPGGSFGYPSTVLMTVIPARVAGVKEIFLITPRRESGLNRYSLAAARVAGASRVFGVGGAQAVAALALGTETIPAVDKIVGPGNIYVATAKRLVFGEVGIDSIAGPSEVVIISDGSSPAEYLAGELLAQAEHDQDAFSLLLSTSREELTRVERLIRKELRNSPPGSGSAGKSWKKNGKLIRVPGMGKGIELVNRFAPEHLMLAVKNPELYARRIKNAGAIFMGVDSAVAFGDYLAGPSHVLPTGGSARFLSPLGVEDFFKRSSLIRVREKGIEKWGKKVAELARMEGLERHARSVEVRMRGRIKK